QASIENTQSRNPAAHSKTKTKTVTSIFNKPVALPAAVSGKKKEVVFTAAGVLLFSAFMLVMWVVFPHPRKDLPGDNETATVLPVDSVSVPVGHRTVTNRIKPSGMPHTPSSILHEASVTKETPMIA